ncbi:MAG: hypothetical protein IJS96_05845 [Schwartzia sp.]|nr:hypothetical protein [Schwartzia sp. (in: firmicutes)]
MNPSATAYDDSFRTLLNDCRELIIPVVNEDFGLQKSGEISEFMKSAICAMTNHVLALIAQRYRNVREGVEHIMGGKILEYEANSKGKEGIRSSGASRESRAGLMA